MQDAKKINSRTELDFETLPVNGFSVIPRCIDENTALGLAREAEQLSIEHTEILSQHDDWEALYNPFLMSQNFVDTVLNPKILSYVVECLGSEAHPILNMQALFNSRQVERASRDTIIERALNRKNHPKSSCNMHTDSLFSNRFDLKSPLLLCFLVALDRFDSETGGTAFVKGSHLREKPRPSKVGGDLNQDSLVIPTLNPGDAVVFYGNTWHLAMPNTTARTRWGLSIRYSHWAIKTMFDYSKCHMPCYLSENQNLVFESLMGKGCRPPDPLANRKYTITAPTQVNAKSVSALMAEQNGW